jgi:hypothetical protein
MGADLPLHAISLDDQYAKVQLAEPMRKLKSLDSAVQTFSYTDAELARCAYMFFERHVKPVIVSDSVKYGTRLNRDPILPKMVNVDTITWNPMITNAGEEGHSYSLVHEGERVASIEVTCSRVIVVHSTYSPAALDASLISPSTRLVFERSHPEKLHAVVDEVRKDDDLIYLPVSEVLLGKALDRIPLRIDHKEHPSASEARRVWLDTRSFLKSMQKDVVLGIQHQNNMELTRTDATEINDTGLYFLL